MGASSAQMFNYFYNKRKYKLRRLHNKKKYTFQPEKVMQKTFVNNFLDIIFSILIFGCSIMKENSSLEIAQTKKIPSIQEQELHEINIPLI